MATMKSLVVFLSFALSLLSRQCHAGTHVLIQPSDEALQVLDEPQCGYMREAYAEMFSQCAPTAVDDDLAHYVDSFTSIQAELNFTDPDALMDYGDRRGLKRKRKRANCGNCRRNPDACCILGMYFHCSICIKSKRKWRRRDLGVVDMSAGVLEDQFRLTSQLPEVGTTCKVELDNMCAIKLAQNKSDEMECWGCTPDGAWAGTLEPFNVISGTEGLEEEF